MTEAAQSAVATPTTSEGVTATSGFSPPENTVATYLALQEQAETAAAAASGEAPAESEEPSSEEQSDQSAPDVASLQALAKEGKFEDLIKALGVDPEGIKIPSSRFAELRKLEQKQKAAHAQREQAIVQREAQVREHVESVLKEYEPFARARKAWADGDIVSAIETAFGESLGDITDKAMKQKLSSDPEVFKLKQKLEAKERAEAEAAEKQRQQEALRIKAEQETSYVKQLSESLTASEDPTIAKAATREHFAQSVYRAQLHAYTTQGVELTAEDAAKQVLEVVRKAHMDWLDVFGATGGASTANSGRPATEVENTTRAGISPEKPRAAKGVSPVRSSATPGKPTSAMTEEERDAYWREQMQRAVIQDRLAAVKE